MRRAEGWILLVLATFVLAGCKPKPAEQSSVPTATVSGQQTTSTPAAAPLPAVSLGSVSGIIHFAGKAPATVRIDMTMDPACGMSSSGDNMSEQFAVQNGRLRNVFVYVKSGPPAASTAPARSGPAIVMDQKGCRYVPHVIGLQKGQSVEFRNSDITMHNIHTLPNAPGSQSIDISQSPKGASQIKEFDQVETMIPVRCNNHPWMNAFINVSETPFFDVSNPDGQFSLKGLPAGSYTLAAVHEKLGEQTVQVVIAAQSNTKADVTFSQK